jgi:SCY1-like protein 2
LESPTHALVDAALRSLPTILPVLDFSTIKNELFPVIAAIFSRTNSLAIKVRGLQAFVILCGGSNDTNAHDDGLNGFGEENKKTSSSSALDKYTMQEKIIPLVKAIKTKEPAVMMAALGVLRVVGQAADADFVAMDILPILWSMSLGPLLDLKQFRTFMDLIKSLSQRVEDEQVKKLQELSGTSNGATAAPNEDFMAFGGITGTTFDATTNGGSEDDFERLVKGKSSTSDSSAFPSWDDTPAVAAVTSPGVNKPSTPKTPAFSWSTPSPTGPVAAPPGQFGAVKAQQPSYRTVTPDLARFETMTPSTTQFSQPMQPVQPSMASQTLSSGTPVMNWSSTPLTAAASNPWAPTSNTSTPTYLASNPLSPSAGGSSFGGLGNSMSSISLNQRPSMLQSSSFSLPPPPAAGGGSSGFSLPPPPGSQPSMGLGGSGAFGKPAAASGIGMGMAMASQIGSSGGGMASRPMSTSMGMGSVSMSGSMNSMAQQQPQASKSGLDKYESLL